MILSETYEKTVIVDEEETTVTENHTATLRKQNSFPGPLSNPELKEAVLGWIEDEIIAYPQALSFDGKVSVVLQTETPIITDKSVNISATMTKHREVTVDLDA